MDTFFGQDGWLYRFLNRLWDLIVLNFLFMITSIPLFTIGASLCALYTVTIKGVKKEDSYIIQSYFRAFRENFKKGTMIWLLLAAVWAVLTLDIFLFGKQGSLGGVIVFAGGLFGVFWILITLYAFPMQARFENSISYTLLNSFAAAIKYFPYTIQLAGMFALVPAAVVVLCVLWPTGLGWFLSLFFFVGFSGIAWMASFPYRKVADKLMEAAGCTKKVTQGYVEK